MGFAELFVLAFGVSMDAFAVSICKGLSVKKARLKEMGTCGIWFGGFQALMPLIGFFLGALFYDAISAFDHWVAFGLLAIIGINMLKEAFEKGEECEDCKGADFTARTMFVMAIAIHNLPEGIAAGVSFGTGNNAHAFSIATGIALQNIPEGMVIIAPMLSAGVKPGKTFVCAMITGLVEVVGTLIGYFAVSVSAAVLPFALAFAGGTMLYVISDEMIPETHAHGSQQGATYALLVGFCVMLVSDVLLG